MRLINVLANKLTIKEAAIFRSGFDCIGDIALIEIPRELERKRLLIARAILEAHKNIKVVGRRGKHEGKYRIQSVRWLAGEKRWLTEHKESGIQLKVNVSKCYFSPRSGSERLRVAKQVKPGESVLVMFSGIAPFPLIIAKHAKPKHIVAVEMNPVAHTFAKENVILNKLQDRITLVKGDVKNILPNLTMKFDRIIMPLPKTSSEFIQSAKAIAKKGAIVHYYMFAKEEELDVLSKQIKKEWGSGKVLQITRTGQVGAREWRVCVDIKI